MFHVVGPQYVSHFGMLDFEIEKYRRLGQPGFGVKQLFTELDERRYSKILIPAWPGLGIVSLSTKSLLP